MSVIYKYVSIPNEDAYGKYSDIHLSLLFNTLRQDFRVKASSIMLERERRLQKNISDLRLRTKNTAWETGITIYKNDKLLVDSSELEVSDMKDISDDLIEKSLWLEIEHDKKAEKEDEYVTNSYKMVNRSSTNKNWVYKKKTERHPKQKKIEKTTRSRKRLKYNQKKERYLFKIKPIVLTTKEQDLQDFEEVEDYHHCYYDYPQYCFFDDE
jgi:hypothetical protein